MNILLPLAALAAGFLVTPATAQALPEPAPVSVHHADLRLDTARGVARLDRRIATAAKVACGTTADYDRAGRKAIDRCRSDVRDQAAAQRAYLIAAAKVRSDRLLAAR